MFRFYNKFHLQFYLLAVLIIFTFLSAYKILFEGAFGFHYIRQTDSISFVANYYRNGFNFFHPEIFNLSSTNGNNACEFPLFYYLTALLYKVFGEKEFLLRFWSIFISFISIIYLYLLVNKWIMNKILASILSLLCISSPIYLYYFFSFLPDSISLAFTIIAWYYFILYIENENKKHYLISIILFTLASLLKVTYFLHPISAFATIIFFSYFKKRSEKININRYNLTLFIISLIIIFLWNYYMLWYNKINNATYFTSGPLPFWNASDFEKLEVFKYLRIYWFSQLYYPSLIHVFYFLILIYLFLWKKTKAINHFIIIILTIGLTSYFLLFFLQFKNHDYYLLNILPLFWFVSIHSISGLYSILKPKLQFFYILFFFVLLLASYRHTNKIMFKRWNTDTSKDYYANIENKLKYTKKYIDNKGISEKSKWIIFTDKSPSGALLKLKRKGWNVVDTLPETIHLYPFYLSQKPDYILFTDKSYLKKYKTENMKFIGVEHNNYIFKFVN